MNDIREKIIESIQILREELYDENNNLYDIEYFKDANDRNNKINLLNAYKSQLDELCNGTPTNCKVNYLRKKPIPEEVVKLMQQKNKKIYLIKLPVRKDYIETFKGISCQIQDADGSYHDMVLLYKGFSEKYKTDFIVYSKNGRIYCVPVVSKGYTLMKKPNYTKEMLNDFYIDFIKKDPKTIDATKYPRFIKCLGADQFDSYEEEIEIDKTTQIPHLVYRYSVTSLPLKYLIESIKKENPDIFIYGTVIEGEIPGKTLSSMMTMSMPVEKIKMPNFDIHNDLYDPEETISSNLEIPKRLSLIKYGDFKQNYAPKISINLGKVSPRLVKHFIGDLGKSNPDSNIQFEENNFVYRISSTTPLCDLKPVANPRGKDVMYENQFGFDKDGYIFTQSQKQIIYWCGKDGICREMRPYFADTYIVNKEKNKEIINDKKTYEEKTELTDFRLMQELYRRQKDNHSELLNDGMMRS